MKSGRALYRMMTEKGRKLILLLMAGMVSGQRRDPQTAPKKRERVGWHIPPSEYKIMWRGNETDLSDN